MNTPASLSICLIISSLIISKFSNPTCYLLPMQAVGKYWFGVELFDTFQEVISCLQSSIQRVEVEHLIGIIYDWTVKVRALSRLRSCGLQQSFKVMHHCCRADWRLGNTSRVRWRAKRWIITLMTQFETNPWWMINSKNIRVIHLHTYHYVYY